jgi:hypothetical protein
MDIDCIVKAAVNQCLNTSDLNALSKLIESCQSPVCVHSDTWFGCLPATLGYYPAFEEFIDIAALPMTLAGALQVLSMMQAHKSNPTSSRAVSEIGAWLNFSGNFVWILYSLMLRSVANLVTSVGPALWYLLVILLKYKYGTGGWKGDCVGECASCYKYRNCCPFLHDEHLLFCGGWMCCRNPEFPQEAICSCCPRANPIKKYEKTSDTEADDDVDTSVLITPNIVGRSPLGQYPLTAYVLPRSSK